MTREADPTGDDALKEAASSARDTRPKRQGLFRSDASVTLAAIGVTCAGIGLASLGLEVLVMAIVGEGPIGTMAGLPIPFVSIPLGSGALFISSLLAVTRPRLAPLPLLSTLAYIIALGLVWAGLA